MNNKQLKECIDSLNKVYTIYWQQWTDVDWKYRYLYIWDILAELEERKISRARYKYWNSWTDQLLLLWEFPRTHLELSCSNKDNFIALCDFLLQIKDYQQYMFDIK